MFTLKNEFMSTFRATDLCSGHTMLGHEKRHETKKDYSR